MRVLIINSVCGRQSTGRIVSDIRKELILQGHECVIAYGEKNSIDIEQNFHIGSELERYVHGMYTRLFDKHCYGSKHATRELVEFIKKYNPDIIHLHNIHGYYLNMEILFNYLKKVQKPIVWTLHDCWIFTGHCSYFTAVKCEQWKQGCDNCPQLKMYPSSWLVDNSKNNWNKKKELFTGLNTVKIITPSYWLAQLVKESFMKEYSVDVIYNGINQSIFKYEPSNIREKYDICDKKKIILGVASIWEKRKGIDDFIVLQKN